MAGPAPAREDLQDCRNSWAATLEALAVEDERIVAVVNVSIGSSKLSGFASKFRTAPSM
jgi:transketolase